MKNIWIIALYLYAVFYNTADTGTPQPTTTAAAVAIATDKLGVELPTGALPDTPPSGTDLLTAKPPDSGTTTTGDNAQASSTSESLPVNSPPSSPSNKDIVIEKFTNPMVDGASLSSADVSNAALSNASEGAPQAGGATNGSDVIMAATMSAQNATENDVTAAAKSPMATPPADVANSTERQATSNPSANVTENSVTMETKPIGSSNSSANGSENAVTIETPVVGSSNSSANGSENSVTIEMPLTESSNSSANVTLETPLMEPSNSSANISTETPAIGSTNSSDNGMGNGAATATAITSDATGNETKSSLDLPSVEPGNATNIVTNAPPKNITCKCTNCGEGVETCSAESCLWRVKKNSTQFERSCGVNSTCHKKISVHLDYCNFCCNDKDNCNNADVASADSMCPWSAAGQPNRSSLPVAILTAVAVLWLTTGRHTEYI